MATSEKLTGAKNLTREAPRSPRQRIGHYVIMARMIDKGRAAINGTNGEYNFDCPMDNNLFGFKGVKGEDVRQLLASGANDEQVLDWFNRNGTPKSEADVKAWSAGTEAARPYDDPKMRDWFVGECKRVGIDATRATLFDFLEVDDRKTFGK